MEWVKAFEFTKKALFSVQLPLYETRNLVFFVAIRTIKILVSIFGYFHLPFCNLLKILGGEETNVNAESRAIE